MVKNVKTIFNNFRTLIDQREKEFLTEIKRINETFIKDCKKLPKIRL